MTTYWIHPQSLHIIRWIVKKRSNTRNIGKGTAEKLVKQYGTVRFLRWQRFDIFSTLIRIDKNQQNDVGHVT